MLALFLLATVATPSGGEPIDNANWIKSTDFSLAAMQNRTDVIYELSFDVMGKPYRCEIITAGRNKAMEKTICRVLLKRAAVTPLVDGAGNAIHFVRRGGVRMRPRFGTQEGTRAASRESGTDIVVKWPDLASGSAVLYVAALEIIDAAGRIETCALIEASSNEKANKTACDVISRSELAAPVKDAAGESVRGARVFDLLFVPGDREVVSIR